VLPEIADLGGSVDAEVRQMYGDGIGRASLVEQPDGDPSIRERFGPHFQRPFRRDAMSLHSLGVLVHGDGFFVEEDGQVLGLHFGQIVAGEQRRGEQTQRVMCVMYSSRFIPPLPISSMSGSFQWPGPAKDSSPAWLN